MKQELINKFLVLEKKKKEASQYWKELYDTISQLAEELGDGGHFQDDDGTVYMVRKRTGKFVQFEPYEYIRTKREGEKIGLLSQKLAEELGYSFN